MGVTLGSQPRQKIHSRLPVQFTWNYTFATIGDSLQVQIIDATGALVIENRYPFSATSGSITVDYKDILNAATSYTPRPSVNVLASISESTARFQFTIKYKAVSSPFWLTIGPYYVFKGGVASLVPLTEYLANSALAGLAGWMPTPTGFASFMPKKRLMNADEWGWIFFFSDVATSNQKVNYTAFYSDSSIASVTKNLVATDFNGAVFHIPIGLPQIGFLGSTSTLAYWTVSVYQDNILKYSIVVNLDPRPNYKPVTLFFRNTFGGYDQFRFRGKITATFSSQKLLYETPDVIKQLGENPVYDSRTRVKWKANTGFITKDTLVALFDLLNTTDALLLLGTSFIPVTVTTKDLDVIDSTDNKYEATFEFELSGDNGITPKELNLIL